MYGYLTPLAAGLGTGLSLIIAIGSQNAFVLRQGLRREHVLPVVGICAVSDAVLIVAGISGIGGLLTLWPAALTVVGWAGAIFLIGYGLLAARRALRPAALHAGGAGGGSLRAAVLTCLALTWLNPHVYLDTVLLLGSVGNGYGQARWFFAAGAVAGSLLWFGALGFGARSLSGVFARPVAWRVLDSLIAVTMLALGVTMAVRASA
ncbi:LysE/ArgO family amino acid transporter [Crossiella sp. SN42]|uniref:LysE/ArgO family amino acid transporter n=1 Tax=Crossiella sp. SN42 TaxID=2944808 RepID=UPI00207CA551|nr:LysE family transporter [Crossiella sp. SN42]MCO1576088.1 LysE/ArgO family amino acid transporter [Crossiella sp. SN42]